MLTRVEWCDDGLWSQLWRLCFLLWTPGRNRPFPQRGFVGRDSTSSRVIGNGRWSVLSVRLRPLPLNRAISSARLWRLTYEWGALLPASRPLSYGPFLDSDGSSSVDGGEEPSGHLTPTISTLIHSSLGGA